MRLVDISTSTRATTPARDTLQTKLPVLVSFSREWGSYRAWLNLLTIRKLIEGFRTEAIVELVLVSCDRQISGPRPSTIYRSNPHHMPAAGIWHHLDSAQTLQGGATLGHAISHAPF